MVMRVPACCVRSGQLGKGDGGDDRSEKTDKGLSKREMREIITPTIGPVAVMGPAMAATMAQRPSRPAALQQALPPHSQLHHHHYLTEQWRGRGWQWGHQRAW